MAHHLVLMPYMQVIQLENPGMIRMPANVPFTPIWSMSASMSLQYSQRIVFTWFPSLVVYALELCELAGFGWRVSNQHSLSPVLCRTATSEKLVKDAWTQLYSVRVRIVVFVIARLATMNACLSTRSVVDRMTYCIDSTAAYSSL